MAYLVNCQHRPEGALANGAETWTVVGRNWPCVCVCEEAIEHEFDV